MTNAVTQSAANNSAQEPAQTSKPTGSTVSKDMFLQLLVAQIKNQDPMNPSDGSQFLAQLAQFQQLEQGINTGQDVAAIREAIEDMTAALKQANANTN